MADQSSFYLSCFNVGYLRLNTNMNVIVSVSVKANDDVQVDAYVVLIAS